MRRPQRRDDLHPHVTPDAVIDMDHEIAGAKALGFGQKVLGPPPLAGLADQAVAQNVLFRDDRDARCLEPMFKRPDRQMNPAFADPGEIGDRDRLGDAFILDQASQTFPRAFRV